MTTAETLTPLARKSQTPLRDFLTGLIDDACGYRLPDGCCLTCTRSDTGRCARHQEDQDRAGEYLALFRAVDAASDDDAAREAFVAALASIGGRS